MRITMTIDRDRKTREQLFAESGQVNKSAALQEAVVFYLQQKKIARIKQKIGKVMFAGQRTKYDTLVRSCMFSD